MVVGGERNVTKYIIDAFKHILGPYKKYFQTDSTTAEIVKYMENSFFATKIAFCNEFFEICKVFGADYNEVREMFVADPRVNPGHTLVFEDSRGFGGKCLPKDLNAIVQAASGAGYDAKLLRQVLLSNTEFRGEA
jgi:UDP-glucose 6-dehydrogenase